VSLVLPWRLRAQFAARLSDLYAREVPAYATLLRVTQEVDADVVAERGPDAERLRGSAAPT